jgi:HD-like signal output (HDOD) protein
MPRVLFVDDEPRILDALSRMLRRFRQQWDMEFAESGELALERCAAGPFDVVASDARMPGMDGTTLLREVRHRHPDTVRIILSGQCSRDAVVQAVGVAHQFLTKPCGAETLKTAIHNVCHMREQFGDCDERVALSRVQRLPSQADHYTEFGRVLHTSSPCVDCVTAVLERDVALSAKMVQLVSSSFFGTPQHAYSAAHAARLLGLETVAALWDSSEAFLSSDTVACGDADVARINTHSLQVARTAQRLASAISTDQHLIGDAFLSGMLHEVGTLALRKNAMAEYRAESFRASVPASGLPSSIDPGGYLAALWGLDEHIVQAISYHRAPQRCPEQQFSPLTILHAAHALVRGNDNDGLPDVDMAYLRRTGGDQYWDRWLDLDLAETPEGVLS